MFWSINGDSNAFLTYFSHVILKVSSRNLRLVRSLWKIFHQNWRKDALKRCVCSSWKWLIVTRYSTVQSFHYYTNDSNRSLTNHLPSEPVGGVSNKIQISVWPGFPGGRTRSLAPSARSTGYKNEIHAIKNKLKLKEHNRICFILNFIQITC